MTRSMRTGEAFRRFIGGSLFWVPEALGTLVKLLDFNGMANLKHVQVYFLHNTKVRMYK